MDVESGVMPGYWSVETNFLKFRDLSMANKPKQIELRNSVKTLEVISHSSQQAQSGLSGAASGAVLGFLVAGPLGTALGAVAGRGSTKKVAEEKFRVRIGLVNGTTIMGTVDPSELNSLHEFLAQTSS